MNPSEKCPLCKRRRRDHQARSLACPLGRRTRAGYTQFSAVSRFPLTELCQPTEFAARVPPDQVPQSFQLPSACETCGAPFVTLLMNRQFAETAEATYKCGAVYHTYLRSSRKDVRKRCSQDAAEMKLRAREAEIDKAVAAALKKVKATYGECEALPKRMERDKGWYLRSGEGIWKMLPPKPEDDA